jgi:hypothetical protein
VSTVASTKCTYSSPWGAQANSAVKQTQSEQTSFATVECSRKSPFVQSCCVQCQLPFVKFTVTGSSLGKTPRMSKSVYCTIVHRRILQLIYMQYLFVQYPLYMHQRQTITILHTVYGSCNSCLYVFVCTVPFVNAS